MFCTFPRQRSMKNTPHSFLNRFLALSLGLAVVALSPSARAATQTWTGATNGAWATSTNWNSAVPAATDTALWNSSSTANLAITLSAAQSVLGLQVLNPAGAVSLSGGTLTTGTGGIDMSAATQNLTISSGLTLGAGQTWTVATGQTLTLNTGAFTRTTGNTLLINDSVNTGTISTTNITTYPGTGYSASPIIGPWAIVESSGAAANNSANGYTYATVSGGNIVAYAGANSLTANSAWGGLSQGNHNGGNYDLSTTGTFTASGGSYYDPFTIRYTGAGFSQSQTIILYTNGIMNAGTGAFTVNEPIQQSDQGTGISSNEITLAAETAPINIAGAIENNGSKPFAVTVTGTSKVTLSGVNTTTGATTISNGSTLVIGAAGGWSTAYAGAISNFGTFTYGSSAAQTLSGVISGAGTLIQNGAGTLTLSNAANSYTGNITVNGGTLAASTAGSNGGNTVLGSDASAGRAITVNNGGILSFTTNDIFGNGTASAANIPSITVNSGGTLTTNNYNPLGNITLDGGTLGATGGSATTGYNVWQFLGSVTVGGNSASAISTFSGSNNADQLGSNTTFTVGVTGAAGGDLIVSAPLANQSTDFASAAGALTKAGPGTMLLSGVNTYTGATTVNAGTLLVTGTTAAGSAVAVNGGGTLGGAGNIGGTVTVAGGSTSAAQGTITLANNLATDTLTLGGLTFGGASAGQTSNLNIEVGNATADMLAITGGLTVNLGGVTVTITNLGVTSGQTYTLANFSGAGTYNGSAFTNLNTAATSVDGFTLSNPNITFGITGQLEITAASGGALELVTSGATTPASAYWKGSKGTQWASNNGTFGNFTADAAGTSLVQAYPASTTTVIFAATGASNLSDSLGTNFNIAGLQFLAQDASSTTIGAVNITDPTYSLTIGSGGISDFNTNGVTLAPSNLIASTNESWTNGSGAALAITSPVAGVASVGNTATLTLSNTNSGATNISGAIGNGGNGGNLALVINDTGSAIVTLSGANTYSGGTTLTAGAVTLGNSSALGTGIVTINGGTLNLAGISPTIGNLQGSGGAISGTATDTLRWAAAAIPASSRMGRACYPSSTREP